MIVGPCVCACPRISARRPRRARATPPQIRLDPGHRWLTQGQVQSSLPRIRRFCGRVGEHYLSSAESPQIRSSLAQISAEPASAEFDTMSANFGLDLTVLDSSSNSCTDLVEVFELWSNSPRASRSRSDLLETARIRSKTHKPPKN